MDSLKFVLLYCRNRIYPYFLIVQRSEIQYCSNRIIEFFLRIVQSQTRHYLVLSLTGEVVQLAQIIFLSPAYLSGCRRGNIDVPSLLFLYPWQLFMQL